MARLQVFTLPGDQSVQAFALILDQLPVDMPEDLADLVRSQIATLAAQVGAKGWAVTPLRVDIPANDAAPVVNVQPTQPIAANEVVDLLHRHAGRADVGLTTQDLPIGRGMPAMPVPPKLSFEQPQRIETDLA